MEYIDARHKLNNSHITQFLSNISDNDIITMFIDNDDIVFEKPLKDFRQFFEDETIEKTIDSDNVVISFMSDTKVLQIIGIDYRYWIEPVRNKKYARLKRLFNDEQTTTAAKQSKTQQTYSCAIATIADNVITIQETFTGSMKELVAYVNKQHTLDKLKTFFKPVNKYAFNYIERQLDLDNHSNWKTFDELVTEGVIVL